MDIVFEYHDVSQSDRLEALATDKLKKLSDKNPKLIRADVFFKKENTSSKETGKICNIRLSVPGPRLFAESSHDSFEASIAESIDDLQRQLRKQKEKMRSY